MSPLCARRRRRWASLVAAAALLGCGGPDPGPPPSVLLLTIDTLRPDYLSFNGYPDSTSPFLDRLFAGGTYFERAISPIARTTPALASLLSGAYPHRTGVRSLTGRLSEGVVSLAEIFHAQGYQTLAVVSNDVLSPDRRLGRGFQLYDSSNNLRVATGTTEALLARLADLDPAAPVFAWIHYLDPHVPYDAPPDVAERFVDPDYDGPYAEGFGNQPRTPGGGRYHAYPEDLPKGRATHRNPLPDAVNAHVRRLYAAEIRATDAEVERLVGAFREARGEEVWIVVTADHGESLGEHDFFFDHGDYVYAAGTRVPLAIVPPASHPMAGGGRCDAWVSLVDLAPTVVELLGFAVAPPLAAQWEGRSLVPCLEGRSLPEVPVFAEAGHPFYPELVRRRQRMDVDGRFRAVTLGDWKLIWTPGPEGDPEGEAWELYDLAEDPHEARDLYRPDHPEVPALRAALDAWLARAADGTAAAPVLSDADREQLRRLGYLE